jgi:hypothetical protein
MIGHLLSHVRSNAIGYLALFVALGGASYAVVSPPAGSVGTRQLRDRAVTAKKLANGAVTPAKLDPGKIAGTIRNWAQVAADGTIVSSGGRANNNGIARDGNYVISWSDALSSRCVAVATSRAAGGLLSPSSGYANTKIVGKHPTAVVVNTYNAQGQPSPAAFSLAVIC